MVRSTRLKTNPLRAPYRFPLRGSRVPGVRRALWPRSRHVALRRLRIRRRVLPAADKGHRPRRAPIPDRAREASRLRRFQSRRCKTEESLLPLDLMSRTSTRLWSRRLLERSSRSAALPRTSRPRRWSTKGTDGTVAEGKRCPAPLQMRVSRVVAPTGLRALLLLHLCRSRPTEVGVRLLLVRPAALQHPRRRPRLLRPRLHHVEVPGSRPALRDQRSRHRPRRPPPPEVASTTSRTSGWSCTSLTSRPGWWLKGPSGSATRLRRRTTS